MYVEESPSSTYFNNFYNCYVIKVHLRSDIGNKVSFFHRNNHVMLVGVLSQCVEAYVILSVASL